MKLSRETAMDLMALADGELEGDAKARAEAIARTHAEARLLVDAMRASIVGEVLEEETSRRAIAAGADTLADAVIARLRADSAAGPVPVARARVRPGTPAPVRLGLVAAAFAFAAAFAIFVRRHPRADVEPSVATRIDLAPASAAPSSIMATAAPSDGVEVDEIDSPAHDISVFEISAGAAAANPAHRSSVVIWVEDGTGSK